VVEGFDKIYNEIEDIFDSTSPPKNINNINGIDRVSAIEGFIRENYHEIYSRIFESMEDHEVERAYG